MKKKFRIALAVSFLIEGCKVGSGTTTPNTESPSQAPSNPAAPTPTPEVKSGSIAINLPTTPVAIMNLFDTSVASSMSTPATLSLNPGTLAISTGLNLNDLTGQPCTSFAFPKDPNVATDTPRNDANFAAGRFYCLLAKNTYAPNSVQGAYYQDKGFLCLLDKAGVPFDGQPHPLDLDFGDTTCFSDEFRNYSFSDGVPPPIASTVIASNPSAIAPNVWDKSVEITLPNGMGTIKMVFKSKENTISSAVHMEKGTPPGSAYAMSLDLQSGILLIDRRDSSTENSVKSQRAFRLLIKGKVNSEGVFESVQSYQGIDLDSYGQNSNFYVSIHSIRGTDNKGYKTLTKRCSSCSDLYNISAYQSNSANAECYAGSNGANSCTDVTPIPFDSSESLKFIPDENRTDFVPFLEWMKGGPLKYTDVKAVQVQ